MANTQNDNIHEMDATSQGEIDNMAEDKHILEQKQQILNNSGVLSAYEYFLRKLCKEGFPAGNVFEYAAQQVIKYEKKKKAEQFRQQTMKKSLAELQLNDKLKIQYGIGNTDQKDKTKDTTKGASPQKKGKDASPEKGKGKKTDDKQAKETKVDPKKQQPKKK